MRERGSLVDTITLVEVVFQYEPKIKAKDETKYASQAVVGRRLPLRSYVGGGNRAVDLDVTLSPGGYYTADDWIAQLERLAAPQKDTGAPHPLYINVGDKFVGRRFILTEVDTRYEVLSYADAMDTQDAMVRLKLEEV